MAAVAVAVRNKRKRQNLQKELEQQQQIQQDSISRANSIDTEPEILKVNFCCLPVDLQ